eukprot:TRINITY_DN9481_c0_g1_i2.p1 TRINITY_DN9481_c0_g1~~TRINITY_DN9481_c0_g1_i2.p1  ORF type:complete len:951 (-),score=277.45 TRINITY_DN9481_c0_g1_i2:327-3179(-)
MDAAAKEGATQDGDGKPAGTETEPGSAEASAAAAQEDAAAKEGATQDGDGKPAGTDAEPQSAEASATAAKEGADAGVDKTQPEAGAKESTAEASEAVAKEGGTTRENAEDEKRGEVSDEQTGKSEVVAEETAEKVHASEELVGKDAGEGDITVLRDQLRRLETKYREQDLQNIELRAEYREQCNAAIAHRDKAVSIAAAKASDTEEVAALSRGLSELAAVRGEQASQLVAQRGELAALNAELNSLIHDASNRQINHNDAITAVKHELAEVEISRSREELLRSEGRGELEALRVEYNASLGEHSKSKLQDTEEIASMARGLTEAVAARGEQRLVLAQVEHALEVRTSEHRAFVEETDAQRERAEISTAREVGEAFNMGQITAEEAREECDRILRKVNGELIDQARARDRALEELRIEHRAQAEEDAARWHAKMDDQRSVLAAVEDKLAHAGDAMQDSLHARDAIIGEMTAKLLEEGGCLEVARRERAAAEEEARAATAAENEEVDAMRAQLAEAVATRQERDAVLQDLTAEFAAFDAEVQAQREQSALDAAREVAEAHDAAEEVAQRLITARDTFIGELAAELSEQAPLLVEAGDLTQRAEDLVSERRRMEQREDTVREEYSEFRTVLSLKLDHREACCREELEEARTITGLRVALQEEKLQQEEMVLREQQAEIAALKYDLKSEIMLHDSGMRAIERRTYERRNLNNEVEELYAELREKNAPNFEASRLEVQLARRESQNKALRQSLEKVEAHAAASVAHAEAEVDSMACQLAEVEDAALAMVQQAESSVKASARAQSAAVGDAQAAQRVKEDIRLELEELDASRGLMRQVGARVRSEVSTALAAALTEDTPSSQRFRSALLSLGTEISSRGRLGDSDGISPRLALPASEPVPRSFARGQLPASPYSQRRGGPHGKRVESSQATTPRAANSRNASPTTAMSPAVTLAGDH